MPFGLESIRESLFDGLVHTRSPSLSILKVIHVVKEIKKTCHVQR